MTTKKSRLLIWDYYEKAHAQAKQWRAHYITWCDIAQTSPDHKVRQDARHQANGCLEIAKSWERMAEQHFETIKNTYA